MNEELIEILDNWSSDLIHLYNKMGVDIYYSPSLNFTVVDYLDHFEAVYGRIVEGSH